MAQKSLNQVELIGNATHDPDSIRIIPGGSSVCNVQLATNRTYATDNGERKEEVEFHRCVAFGKLAEIMSSYVHKGSRIFVKGRLSTRKFTTKDNIEKTRTEIIMEDMILLDKKES